LEALKQTKARRKGGGTVIESARSLPDFFHSLLIPTLSMPYVDHPDSFRYFISIATMGIVYLKDTIFGI